MFALVQLHVGDLHARWSDAGRIGGRQRSSQPPWARRLRVGVRVSGGDQLVGPLDERWDTLGPRSNPPVSRAELRALGIRPKGLGLINLRKWPSEPKTPDRLRRSRLADALAQVCDLSVSSEQLSRYARWIIRYGGEFSVDPLLLAAVIAQQSGCRAHRKSTYGLGLALINFGMYARGMQHGYYLYGRKRGGRWFPRRLPLRKFPFERARLLDPEANIYFAAALLAVFRDQCPSIDRPFRSTPHRHFISHFVWGDRVVDVGPEDRILLTRRRLLEYYLRRPRDPGQGRFKGIVLDCPVDGAPRKVTSGIGEVRDGGRRRHSGIDVDSTHGEPVRAVADGIVTLAGVDWGHEQLANLEPTLTGVVPTERVGPRGLLVKIRHRDGLTSVYMHLAAYTVRAGQSVKRGQKVGFVGKTGIKQSPPHLHFEMWQEDKLIDPLGPLAPYLFGPHLSHRGQRILLAEQRRRHRANGPAAHGSRERKKPARAPVTPSIAVP